MKVSLQGLSHWQQCSRPVAPVRLLSAQKQCPSSTTTEQNKIWGWTNSCRISGSFIQIAHFPCFFLSLSPPPHKPEGRHHSWWKRTARERERETVGEIEWQTWRSCDTAEKRERERNSCIERDYGREAVAKSGYPLCLTNTRWQRLALQLFSLAALHLLSVIDSL